MFSDDSFRFFSDSSDDARLSAMLFSAQPGSLSAAGCGRATPRWLTPAHAGPRLFERIDSIAVAKSVSSKESFRRHSRIRPPLPLNSICDLC